MIAFALIYIKRWGHVRGITNKLRNFAANYNLNMYLDMITTAIPAKPLDSFTLELPKGDTAFLKTIARKMGWTVRSNRRKMSAYERSLNDERNGRVNHYASSEEFFNKMGI